MIRIHNLPDWFHSVTDPKADNVLPAITVAFERNGAYFFDGVISAMLGQNKIPHTLEIALNAHDMSCIARLNYGDEEDSSALYAPFEVESFAFLWNANPKIIHGIHGNRITLALQSADTRYPFINSAGITSELFLKGDVFVAQPDLEFAHEWEEAA